MRTIKECRQRAQDCLRLATTATDFFAQDALIRRAAACETMAEALDVLPVGVCARHKRMLHMVQLDDWAG